MRSIVFLLALSINFNLFAAKIPSEITNDFLKASSIELLMGNIKEYYQITDFFGGRTTESNGKEIALGIVQFEKSNKECKKIVAAVREANCPSVKQCEVEGYLIDCDKGVESLNDPL